MWPEFPIEFRNPTYILQLEEEEMWIKSIDESWIKWPSINLGMKIKIEVSTEAGTDNLLM